MTAWTLFLDDIRYPEDVRYNYGPYKNVRICRSMDDAVWAVKQYGLPVFLSFDHDLADTHYIIGDGEKTGYTFAKWFCDYVMDNNLRLPVDFGFYVHSQNPVGAENIRKYMENFLAAKWFCDYVMDNNLRLPVDFGFFVHSMNPAGDENIRKYMENFLKEWNNG